MTGLHLARLAVLGCLLGATGACGASLARVQDPPRSHAVTTGGPWASMVYAARTDAGVVLVDLGWAGAEGGLREALRAVDAETSDVTAVLLTHSHRDHIAGWPLVDHARFFLARPEVPLLLGWVEHRDLGSRMAEWVDDTDLPRPGRLRLHPFARDTTLVFGRDTVRAWPVPGHTAGSAAYLLRGILFLGDAASWYPLLGLGGPRGIYSTDAERGRESVEALLGKLESEQVEWICTAHARCEPFSGALGRESAGEGRAPPDGVRVR